MGDQNARSDTGTLPEAARDGARTTNSGEWCEEVSEARNCAATTANAEQGRNGPAGTAESGTGGDTVTYRTNRVKASGGAAG